MNSSQPMNLANAPAQPSVFAADSDRLQTDSLLLAQMSDGTRELRATQMAGKPAYPFCFCAEASGDSGAITKMGSSLQLLAAGNGVLWSVSTPEGTVARSKPWISWHFRHFSVRLEFDRGSLQVATGVGEEYHFDELPSSITAIDNERGAISVLQSKPDLEAARCNVRTYADGRPTAVDFFVNETSAGRADEASFEIYPNAYPFPSDKASSWRLDDPLDLRVTLGGIYAAAAASLGGAEISGSAYPTMRAPLRAYGDLHTFFDIDAYFTVATLCLSGDSKMETEARGILKRAASHQKADGQIPHHFDNEDPVWLAISGASQLGPNLFWLIAAHDYFCNTGDEGFLQDFYLMIRLAAEWVVKRYNPVEKLIVADGPLWIDVFRKSGYTYDSNAMAIWVLGRIAPLCSHCGDSAMEKRLLQVVADLRIP